MLAIHVPKEKNYTYIQGKNKANVVKNNIQGIWVERLSDAKGF